ncbi:Xylulose kinase [Streptomyces fumanus]
MGIVAGLDSSPDFTRIVVCDADTGAVLRQGYAPHPVESPETGGRPSDVDPQAWLLSLGEAAGGGLLEGVQAIGVSAQANTVVPLDAQGATVRPALVGGDKRAQVAAADLIDALGGREAWAQAVGAVPGAAHTGDQAALAGADRAGGRRADRRPDAGARLAGVAVARAGRPAGPPTGAGPRAPGTGRRRPAATGPTWWNWPSATRRCCRR